MTAEQRQVHPQCQFTTAGCLDSAISAVAEKYSLKLLFLALAGPPSQNHRQRVAGAFPSVVINDMHHTVVALLYRSCGAAYLHDRDCSSCRSRIRWNGLETGPRRCYLYGASITQSARETIRLSSRHSGPIARGPLDVRQHRV
jgi:hypothetical protein